MCGRSVHPKRKTLEEVFKVTARGDTSGVFREVTPGDLVIGITAQYGLGKADEQWDEVSADAYTFGAIEGKFYNARIETVDAKQSWSTAWEKQDFCIVPSAQFKEGWAWFALPDEQPIAMAALIIRDQAIQRTWDGDWEDIGDAAVVLTTTAIGACATTHNRMPIMLTEDMWAGWMDDSLLSQPITKQDLITSSNAVASKLVRV